MGLIYSSGESAELIQALTSNLTSSKDVVNQLKAGSQNVVAAVDGQTLSGAAYTAGKGLFSELIIPTITRVTTAIDTIEQELQKYQSADQVISDEGYLDEDNLAQQLTIKKAMKTSVEASSALAKNAARANPTVAILDALFDFQKKLTTMSENLQKDIDKLNKKLEKLRNFAQETNNLFSNSLSDLKLAMQGVLVLNGTTVNSDGTYTFPAGADKNWFTKLQNAEKLAKANEKQAYIELLQEQFGFDKKTAKQIFKIKEGLDEKFPKLSQKERDYLFARIIGEFSYHDGIKNILMWDNTAGGLADYFYTEVNAGPEGIIRLPKELKEILSELGLSNKEYNELYYNLRLQHELSAISFTPAHKLDKKDYDLYKAKFIQAYGESAKDNFDDFWNKQALNFSNKGDFTHQSITTATILDENLRLANMSGIITGSFTSQSVDELAGWRGDTTKVPAENPSIGNDDYKADLDAVNIAKRMKNNNISYAQASNEYYNDLANGQSNRAKEFKNNEGYDYVKNEILADLAPNYEYTAGNKKYQTKIEERPDAYNAHTKRELTEQEKLDYLKKYYPDSYNFIESLKNNENEYTDYADK